MLEIDRGRLEKIACECYAVMQSRIKRMYDEELPVGSSGRSNLVQS
jgi:hypothetical protein